MSEQKPEFSRVRRNRKNGKANKLLNWMIAIVVLLIVIVGVRIVVSDSNAEKSEANVTETTPDGVIDENDGVNDNKETESKKDEEKEDSKDEEKESTEDDDAIKEGTVKDESVDEDDQEKEDTNKKEEKKEDTVTYSASDDAVVDETISNTSWEPIGTSQQGNHVSVYDGKSKDWQEKEKALSYATGLSHEDMIFWKIKNGGSPQKSIGIVSSKDKSAKYRVYLEWVDGEGWKPTQMDVLNTLDFKY